MIALHKNSQQSAGDGLGKAVPLFEKQNLTDSFTFIIVFRLSLPSHSALRYRVLMEL